MFQPVRYRRTCAPLVCLLMGCVLFLSQLGVIRGQGITSPTSSSPPLSPSTTQPNSPPAEDVIYLPDEQGVLRRVPLNASLQEYLAFQKQQASSNTEPVTKYAIQSLDVQGQLVTFAESRQFAELIINVDVQVYQSSWTLVNLKMQELVFTEPILNQGQGEFSFNQRDRLQGVTVWLKGKGVHKLQIKGMLPVRSQQLWKRLQLSLPASTVSEFRMLAPARSVQLRDVERYPLAQTEPRDDKTQIRLVDLQEKLDLSWLEDTNGSDNAPIINAFNSLQIRMIDQTLEMSITQRLEVSQDSLSSLTFKLPAGWDLYDVRFDRSTITKQQAISGNDLQIDLDRPVSGRAEIHWMLRRPLPSPTETISIAPVLLPAARRQITEITLQEHPELQFQIGPGNGKSDKPVNGLTTRQSANGPVYLFRSPPSELPVQVLPRQAVYSTTLTASFQPDKQQCKLTVYVDVQVVQGILRSLNFNWPAYLEAEWKILPSTDFQLKASRSDAASLRKELLLTRGISNSATIQLDFVRPLVNSGAGYHLTWPTPVDPTPLQQFVVITDSRQVETTLDPNSQKLVTYVPKTLWRQAYTESSRLTPLSKLMTVTSSTSHLTAQQTIVEQDVTARVNTTIKLDDNHIDLTQEFDYRIEWSGTRQFDLDCPADFTGNFQLSQNQVPVTTQWESLPQEGGRMRLRLYSEQPITGDARLVISSQIPITSEENQGSKQMILGLARPSVPDVFISNTQISTVTSTSRQIYVKDADANPIGIQNSSQNVYAFQEAPLSVTVDITSTALSDSRYEVRSGRISSRMVAANRLITHADYILDHADGEIRFRLPESSRVSRVSVNGRVIPYQSTLVDGYHFVLIPAEGTARTISQINEPQLVSIEYQSVLEEPVFGVSKFRIPQPDFLVSSDHAARVWQLQIFPQQHLFSWSTSLIPQFRWLFRNGFWVRVNQNHHQPPATSTGASLFHSYDFEVFGSSDLRCRAISQSSLLLIGCGTGLLLPLIVFLLLKASQLPSVLALIFTTCLLGTFFQSSMGGILLQPFLAGLVFGGLAVYFDRRYLNRSPSRRGRSRPITASATIGGSSITYHGRSIDWESMADRTQTKAPPLSAANSSSKESHRSDAGPL